MKYRSDFYVFDEGKPIHATLRNYQINDFDELIQMNAECFPPPFPADLLWNKEQLKNHITLFPEGAICIEVNGEIAGSLTALLVDFDPEHPNHTWEEVTDCGYIRTHQPDGDTLYIVDISVRPKYRKMGLGKLMIQAMYHLVVQKGLERLLGGGRMPGYHEKSGLMSPEQYIEEVLAGIVKDPVITFLLKCGRTPLAIVNNYLDDVESHNYGVLMEWKNPFRSNR